MLITLLNNRLINSLLCLSVFCCFILLTIELAKLDSSILPTLNQPSNTTNVITISYNSLDNSNLNFDFAEKQLRGLRFNKNNQLILKKTTLNQLNRLYEWQIEINSEKQKQRANFLTHKFFSNQSCFQSFTDLWERFFRYKNAIEKQKLSLRKQIDLQTHYFSTQEIKQLFSEKNHLIKQLLSR